MNATRKPTSGGVDDLKATLRRRHADADTDPPAGAPAGPPVAGPAESSADAEVDTPVDTSVDTGTGGSADTRGDSRVDARVRETADPLPGEAEQAAEALAGPSGAQEADEDAPGRQKPVQGPRRMLEVKARAYMGGWRKIRPRAEALADAVRAVLAVGGTVAEVRGLLAELDVPPDAIPPEVREALKRPARP